MRAVRQSLLSDRQTQARALGSRLQLMSPEEFEELLGDITKNKIVELKPDVLDEDQTRRLALALKDNRSVKTVNLSSE